MGIYKSTALLIGLWLFPAILFAQFNNNTSSPYSRFAIGELQGYSFGRTTAMGGASLASRNNQQINLANPASYTAVDSLGFMFEFGLNAKFSRYSNDITSMTANDINFRYFAMNFQITNWLATSLGLTPYSDVGYYVDVQEEITNAGNIINRYYGEGSLSKAYAGFAVEPFKNFSFGVNLNYLFGMLNRNSETYFPSIGSFYNNQKFESLRLRDFSLTFGTQATIPLNSSNRIILAAVFENPNYTGFYSDLRNKYISVPQGNTSVNDSKRDTIDFQSKINVQFPLTYGFGISFIKDNTIEINADYYHQGWSDVILPGSGSEILTDLDRFAFGAEWVPDRFSIRSYLSRVAYRAGIKYERSYLTLGQQQIKDYGITFGVGLPVYRSNSTVNISAELGRKGTKKDNLLLENYARINLSMNLYDLWFIQRRFD
jgi:hypothetical protein